MIELVNHFSKQQLNMTRTFLTIIMDSNYLEKRESMYLVQVIDYLVQSIRSSILLIPKILLINQLKAGPEQLLAIVIAEFAGYIFHLLVRQFINTITDFLVVWFPLVYMLDVVSMESGDRKEFFVSGGHRITD